MWTTAGRTRSATLIKADCRASVVFADAGAADRTPGEALIRSAWSQNPAPRKAKSALAWRMTRALLGVI
jgi:hypothetical protein